MKSVYKLENLENFKLLGCAVDEVNVRNFKNLDKWEVEIFT